MIALYRDLGWDVIDLSDVPRSTPRLGGLPDLLVLAPHAMFWHETKRHLSGGRMSRQRRAQAEFATRCARQGVTYIIGGRKEAALYAARHAR